MSQSVHKSLWNENSFVHKALNNLARETCGLHRGDTLRTIREVTRKNTDTSESHEASSTPLNERGQRNSARYFHASGFLLLGKKRERKFSDNRYDWQRLETKVRRRIAPKIKHK